METRGEGLVAALRALLARMPSWREGAGSRLLGWVGGAEGVHDVWSCMRADWALRTLW